MARRAPRSARQVAISMSDSAEYEDDEEDVRLKLQQRIPRSQHQHVMAHPYDLTPVDIATGRPIKNPFPSYSIDPWEGDTARHPTTRQIESTPNNRTMARGNQSGGKGSIFIGPGEIHHNMEARGEEIARLRLLAGQLSLDWKSPDFMPPALARRIRDFQFAQEKRRKKYGDERPWGILGLYDHLASIRIDVEWAEDAATRRANGDSYQSWADFDESKKGGSNRPYFTYALLFVSLLLMILSIGANQWEVEPLDENPMVGPSAETLIGMGAKDAGLIVNNDEWWRLLTSAFLHAGLVHYVVNMLALWFVGAAIEMTHGWVAAMLIFFLSALGGTVLSAIFLPEYITVGASGGIFGFIGACLADILMNWKLLFNDFVTENGKKHHHAMVIVVLIFDIILNSIIGLTPFIDNFTHLGGMLFGLLCGLSTIERLSADFFGLEEQWTTRAKHFCMQFSGLVLAVCSLIVSLVILFQGDGKTTPCPECAAISCVTFPPWAEPTKKWWYCDDCGTVSAELGSQPYYHMNITCPGGAIASIDLSEKGDLSTSDLQRKLPSYCREYCPLVG